MNLYVSRETQSLESARGQPPGSTACTLKVYLIKLVGLELMYVEMRMYKSLRGQGSAGSVGGGIEARASPPRRRQASGISVQGQGSTVIPSKARVAR